jgi:dipeptidyl aminopeptidase/acylaminoacyl peptidase
MRLIPCVTAAALLATASPVLAQKADRLSLSDYLEFEQVNGPELSPDGGQIIYGRRWIDKVNDRWESSLYIMNNDGTKPRKLVDGSSPRWSPDGRRVAFLSRGEPGGTQIFVRWMDAEGATTQITRVSDSPADIQWSPDGKWLAFRALVPNTNNGWKIEGRVAALKPRGASWTASPRVVEALDYRQDRVGFTADGVQQIFVVPADGGTPRQVTSGEWSVGSPNWSPDGKTIVFSSGPRIEDAEYAWRESEIYSVDVATGAVHQLTTRKGPDNGPSISPDGKLIAYTGYDWSTDTWVDSKMYVMNADGSNAHVLVDIDRSPSNLIWAPDGTGVYFTIQDGGSQNLWFAPLNGKPRKITDGKHMLGVDDIGTDGTIVGTLSTSKDPGDIVTLNVKRPAEIRPLTDVNADILYGKKLGDVEEIWYTSVDGLKIQGWIVKPPDFDPSHKYPLMLSIHGGPHSMYNVGFNFGYQEHAANGYVVLYTNPRGSTGYGSEFGNAIKNAYPSKDFDDLMKGVDEVIGRGYVDTDNLFVYGCSGGGVLTAWTVGHTDRFAAATAMCPVIDWISFVGNTDSPGWYRNFEKLPWEDPSEHLRRSPLMYVGNVKTPTMLMTGVNDLRTPIGQTEEFYEALKIQKVPTAMVRFNNEWHGTSSTPSNFIRTQLYLRDWFGKYARGALKPVTQN